MGCAYQGIAGLMPLDSPKEISFITCGWSRQKSTKWKSGGQRLGSAAALRGRCPVPVPLRAPPYGERGWSFLNEGRRNTPKPPSSLPERCARAQPEQHKRICCTALCRCAKSKPVLRGVQYVQYPRAVDWSWKFPPPPQRFLI